MRYLIAISSCYDFEKNGSNDAMRDTWLPDLQKFGVDYRFFMGFGQGAENSLVADSVFLPDVPDDYGHLTYKTRSSVRWAHEHQYDFVFRCFPDTYVRVNRLMACAFRDFDYYGDFRGDPSTNEVTHQKAQNYASGGPGYWLSKRAYSLLLDAPVLGVWRDEITPYTEDLWTGNILGRHLDLKLTYFDDTKRFINRGSRFWPTPQNDVISSHLSCPDRYTKEMMYAAHQPWGK
jgi:hypothetical protein